MKQNKVFIIYILCAITIFLFIAFVFGAALKFFLTMPYFDKFLHLFSAMFVTGVLGFWLAYKAKMRPLYTMLFAFSFAMMLGIMFELLEFAVDSLFTTNHQHWMATEADRLGFFAVSIQGSGLIDTMGDIIANTIGAAITSVLSFLWLKFINMRYIEH